MGRPRLPDEDYEKMRRLREQGKSYQAIAEDLGRHRATIYNCLNGYAVKKDPVVVGAQWAMRAI